MTQPEVELAWNEGKIGYLNMVKELARANAYNEIDTIDDIEGVLCGVLTPEAEEATIEMIHKFQEEDN